MERVGEARLAQDAEIQSRFLAGWNTTLNTNLKFATRARQNVEKARLTLDAVKARVKGTTWKIAGSPKAETHEEQELSPEAQEEIEKAEDDFVTQTEEAVSVMKNVGSPLPNMMKMENRIGKQTLTYSPAGPGHPRAASQPCGSHRRSNGVPQEGPRDP